MEGDKNENKDLGTIVLLSDKQSSHNDRDGKYVNLHVLHKEMEMVHLPLDTGGKIGRKLK